MMDLDTTIVAVSSPFGRSSRAMIRMSGDQSFECARKIGLTPIARQMSVGRVSIGSNTLPVLCTAFSANASYTGQDTIEIQLPNNAYLIQTCIQLLLDTSNGRRAEAGEFTARAFFNGNITLSEAEGVCATISANNNAELQGASLLRTGAFASVIEPVAIEITRILALVEAGIDFVDEEDVVAITEKDMQERVDSCIGTIQSVLDGHIAMETLRDLPNVVIAGAPNAGKSTLFNALIGTHRVVVSHVAGTTRDAIAEPAMFGDKEAMLVDIAGTEDATDQLSAAAQHKAKEAIEAAEVVLWCVAPESLNPTLSPNMVVVHTKADCDGAHAHAICALSGKGVDVLQTEIESRLTSMPTPQKDAIALLPRHEAHLHDALQSLLDVQDHALEPELVATSLRLALNAMGAITGQVTPDEVLGKVFATFCVGK